ncbi:hypothetical protein CJF42_07010 [Pseudoalteromonas sp. NBT06-2]|uniref:LysR family transcriptional regulator n=1 Tax=Pseudoalteromonas sp. NBT06-2 TaxID=2025950 RepID=UPI000BA6111E|nr:LysR family transcriptional regulator [Pseudoalteromonas sp. NBT06-2]PAJ75114.1 hypothetical protein CJF42_07010 [Pseudoalteromonas sp. NBT06-2]
MKANLDDLYMFVVLVESGSFTLAAKKLNMPKSKLSRHLVQLEKKLATQLLIRTTRSQELTQSGQLLYQKSKPHIEALYKVEEEVASFISEPKGQLNILLPLEFFNRIISELITDFAKQYPKISLTCSHYSGDTPEINHTTDLTFVLHELPLPTSNLIGKNLLSFPQSLFASIDYDITKLSKPEHLANESCILANPLEQWLFRDKDKLQTVPIDGRVVLPSPEMRLEAMHRGLGIVKLPDYTCQGSTTVKKIKLTINPVAQQLSVLYQSRSIPLKTRAFLDFFQNNIGRLS